MKSLKWAGITAAALLILALSTAGAIRIWRVTAAWNQHAGVRWTGWLTGGFLGGDRNVVLHGGKIDSLQRYHLAPAEGFWWVMLTKQDVKKWMVSVGLGAPSGEELAKIRLDNTNPREAKMPQFSLVSTVKDVRAVDFGFDGRYDVRRLAGEDLTIRYRDEWIPAERKRPSKETPPAGIGWKKLSARVGDQWVRMVYEDGEWRRAGEQ